MYLNQYLFYMIRQHIFLLCYGFPFFAVLTSTTLYMIASVYGSLIHYVFSFEYSFLDILTSNIQHMCTVDGFSKIQ
jgi:hypothetical protein